MENGEAITQINMIYSCKYLCFKACYSCQMSFSLWMRSDAL